MAFCYYTSFIFFNFSDAWSSWYFFFFCSQFFLFASSFCSLVILSLIIKKFILYHILIFKVTWSFSPAPYSSLKTPLHFLLFFLTIHLHPLCTRQSRLLSFPSRHTKILSNTLQNNAFHIAYKYHYRIYLSKEENNIVKVFNSLIVKAY